MDKPEIEFKNLTLNDKITLELTVMDLVQIGEFMQYAIADFLQNGIGIPHGVTKLSNALADALMTPASIKAYDAATAQAKEDNNPLNQIMRMAAEAGVSPFTQYLNMEGDDDADSQE